MNKPQPVVIGAAVAVFTVGIVAGVAVFGGASDDAKIDVNTRATNAATYDTAPLHTDLLSAPVAPGDTVATGVTLPAGGHNAGVVLTGPAVGSFDVVVVTETPTDDGGVWFEVRATNTSKAAVRFTAFIGYSE